MSTLTPAFVCKRRMALESRITHARYELVKLREACPHPDAVRRARADVGNWDRSLDRYWFDYECPDCGKRWEEPQK